MNSAQKLYLGTYSRIDHLIKNCRMRYQYLEYYYAPFLHAKALAIVTAYDICLEVVEGKLDEEWYVKEPVDI